MAYLLSQKFIIRELVHLLREISVGKLDQIQELKFTIYEYNSRYKNFYQINLTII